MADDVGVLKARLDHCTRFSSRLSAECAALRIERDNVQAAYEILCEVLGTALKHATPEQKQEAWFRAGSELLQKQQQLPAFLKGNLRGQLDDDD